MLPVADVLHAGHAVIEVVGAGVRHAVAIGEGATGPNGMCVTEVARLTAPMMAVYP